MRVCVRERGGGVSPLPSSQTYMKKKSSRADLSQSFCTKTDDCKCVEGEVQSDKALQADEYQSRRVCNLLGVET